MKLAIFGSADGAVSVENERLCKNIVVYLKQKEVTIVTGGSLGVPGLIARLAFEAGAETEVYSPDENAEQHHARSDNAPLHYFKKHTFNSGFTARSLEMIKNIDGAIVIGGRIGTLSEFTIAVEEGLDIAVMKGSGGIADHLEYILLIAKKEFQNKILFEENYKEAIDKLLGLRA